MNKKGLRGWLPGWLAGSLAGCMLHACCMTHYAYLLTLLLRLAAWLLDCPAGWLAAWLAACCMPAVWPLLYGPLCLFTYLTLYICLTLLYFTLLYFTYLLTYLLYLQWPLLPGAWPPGCSYICLTLLYLTLLTVAFAAWCLAAWLAGSLAGFRLHGCCMANYAYLPTLLLLVVIYALLYFTLLYLLTLRTWP